MSNYNQHKTDEMREAVLSRLVECAHRYGYLQAMHADTHSVTMAKEDLDHAKLAALASTPSGQQVDVEAVACAMNAAAREATKHYVDCHDHESDRYGECEFCGYGDGKWWQGFYIVDGEVIDRNMVEARAAIAALPATPIRSGEVDEGEVAKTLCSIALSYYGGSLTQGMEFGVDALSAMLKHYEIKKRN